MLKLVPDYGGDTTEEDEMDLAVMPVSKGQLLQTSDQSAESGKKVTFGAPIDEGPTPVIADAEEQELRAIEADVATEAEEWIYVIESANSATVKKGPNIGTCEIKLIYFALLCLDWPLYLIGV